MRALVVLALIGFAAFQPVRAADERFSYPQQFTMSPTGVNIQTGRFNYSKTDLSIGSLSFVRSWGGSAGFLIHGRPAFGTPQGYVQNVNGWKHSHLHGVNGVSGVYKVYAPTGEFTFFDVTFGTSTIPVPRDTASQGANLYKQTVSQGVTQLILTDKSGNLFIYSDHAAWTSAKLLTEARFANGSTHSYSYNTTGQPRTVMSSDGYAIVLDYANGNVSEVCGYNRAVTVVTTATTCAGAVLKVTYGYGGPGNMLTSISRQDGSNTSLVTMTYASTPLTGLYLPSCISLPNSAVCEIANLYGPQPGGDGFQRPDQVAKQTAANGGVWSYSYIPEPDPQDQPIIIGEPRIATATMTDPQGFQSLFTYDRGRLIQSEERTGPTNYKYAYRTFAAPSNYNLALTEYQYHASSPTLVTSLGYRDYFEQDVRGNIVSVSRWPAGPDPVLSDGSPAVPSGFWPNQCCISPTPPVFPAGAITRTRNFPPDAGYQGTYNRYVIGCGGGTSDAKLCDKPVSVTDARGNTTNYTYDPAHGGVLSERLPAVGGARPETRYVYEQKQARVKDASGSLVQSGVPTWLLASKFFCKTGEPVASTVPGQRCGDGYAAEVVTTYDYGPDSGPNNLLLRGLVEDALGQALRTCYAYDWQGNRITETRPRAGLASCP